MRQPFRFDVVLLISLLAMACAGSSGSGGVADEAPESEAQSSSSTNAPSRAVASGKSGSGPSSMPGSPDNWHAVTFVRARGELRLIHYWSKGPWMRAETLIAGHPVVTLVRGQDYIVFDRLSGEGVRIRRAPEAVAEDAARPRPFGNDLAELIAQGAEKVEDTTVSDRPAEIWRVTDGGGRRKLWVSSNAPQVPIRLEVFVRAGGETITTDYSSWARGLGMSDAFFEVPAGASIESFDYAGYLDAAVQRPIGPILYPDLLHGLGAR